ncbi:hypothetical protein IWX49DRAFT_285892 [Phyllosticta citricarpa]
METTWTLSLTLTPSERSMPRSSSGALLVPSSPPVPLTASGFPLVWAHGSRARVFRTTSNSSFYEALTDGNVHSGFPSYSANGRYIVFRECGVRYGLRIIDLADKSMRFLTNATDNLPYWSPDGERIVFTRKTNSTNFDVCTIRPDGSDLRILTWSDANDAHAVWSHDGRILYNSGMYDFREECAVYDDTFQPYGQIMSMYADGSNKTMLTDSMWEDLMPLYVPNEYLC